MDTYVSSNPIMCFPCIQLLVTVYNFKTRCLNTETIIRSYIQRHNLSEYNHVSLSCVVQELIRLNNYFRDVQHRKIDGDKPNMENCPQNANGMPRVPCGPPQGIPGCQLRPSEGQAVPMDHESVPGGRVIEPNVQGVNVNVNGSQIVAENQFVPRHRDVEEHRGVMHGLPINSVLLRNQDGTLESRNVTRDEIVPNYDTSNEGLENLNAQNYQKPIDSVVQNLHCSEVENQNASSNDLEGKEREKQDKESTTAQPEESTDDTTKTDTSQDNVTGSFASKSEVEKGPITENRPRLIIRICKNKITIPQNKNENLNEKENEKMDVEVNGTEMPPPETDPFDAYQPQDDNELYQCSNCTFVTTHLDSYVIHKNVCGSELTEKKCPHCSHVTNRQYALNKHINTMHTKSVWYICDSCPYRSTDSSCLRRHKRNVHPERLGNDLMCQMCSYRCTTEYHLKKHMLKHTDNAPLQCQFCSYSTRDRSNFRKHVFIHNPTPQGCEFCSYKCVSPYQMKLHLKKAHHGVGMEDVDCRSEVSISEVVQDISAAIKEAKCYATQPTE
ncbi:RE1-silencing transcription factor B-like isoform X2 [Anoplophora glabripennis]|nr:RE1-silencing transcription factor B-like isoform X2 [Anoplophora glabripennis]